MMDCRCRYSISNAQMPHRRAGQLGLEMERRLTGMDMRHGQSCRFVCKPEGVPSQFHSCLNFL